MKKVKRKLVRSLGKVGGAVFNRGGLKLGVSRDPLSHPVGVILFSQR